jgi:hypothetical protein
MFLLCSKSNFPCLTMLAEILFGYVLLLSCYVLWILPISSLDGNFGS